MSRALAASIVLLLAGTIPAAAGPPTLDGLFPPGGHRGQTVAVKAAGSFGTWPVKVWTEDEAIAVSPLPEKGKLSIAIAPGARVGVHWLRLFDDEGATALRPFLVGTLPEVAETEPNDDPTQPQRLAAACVTINGKLDRNGDVDGFAVTLQKGQTLVAALEANRRLGSPLDGLLQVVSAAGFVLGENDDGPDHDPLLIFHAPADGTYIVRAFAFPLVPDSKIGFAGGDAFVYRLTLTTQGFVDHLYPLAVPSTGPGRVEAVGWNIDESARWLEVDPGAAGERAAVVALDHPLLANAGEVRLEPHPAAIEVEPNSLDSPQVITLPATISGRIDRPRDQDVYQFAARKGEKWLIRVESRSLGHPLDAVLRVLDSAGKVLNEVDDPGSRRRSTTRDPELTFSAAADGTYRVVVRDLNSQGSFRHVYRLSMTAPAAGFELTLAADRFTITPDTPLKIPVTVVRDDGFNGKIDVEALGLPEGVVATIVTSLPTGPTAKTVTLALCTHQGPWSGPIQIIGRVDEGDATPKVASTPLPSLNTSTEHLWLTVLKPAAAKDRAAAKAKK
jgi:hypothetical protein